MNHDKTPVPRLLKITEAAESLGYTVRGLRNIITRSRAKARGEKVRGPVIKFFQTSRRAPVMFKQEWIDEFIEANTIDPYAEVTPRTKPKRPKPQNHLNLQTDPYASGLDAAYFDV